MQTREHPPHRKQTCEGAAPDKGAELADVVATLCAFDISEIAQVWWTDVNTFKKENLKAEDSRVKSLVKRLLVEDEEPIVGLAAVDCWLLFLPPPSPRFGCTLDPVQTHDATLLAQRSDTPGGNSDGAAKWRGPRHS
eukprot:symbB.v1.2.019247.t1/scaffold1507.1/size116688/10